ncbi:MAG: gliding motility lipoprotein GldH [Prevotellaceae bacterium]|jgi:gliding motility-associated lipoprotein GldH|nr:gliding motility lipoprotein GldH [Prevotellaceae bacterium]
MTKNVVPVLLGMALCLASACDNTRVYERYKDFSTEGWHKDSLAVFEVSVDDTLGLNNVYINLRNTSSYPFCNIYLFVTARSPQGAAMSDTVEYMLSDDYGRWLGKGFSKYIDNRLIFRKQVQFPRRGIYQFEIQQGMRMDVLPQVSNVGLRIEKES